jgi:hypothetical protein
VPTAEFCSCGAQLPPDALFCHKCGKPQREITEPEPALQPAPQSEPPLESEPVPRLPVRPQALPVGFHGPVAVRIALMLAAAATVLSFLLFVNWLAAGFFAVFFYRRKTGSPLNVSAGARLGWMTGILMFGMTAVVFTAEQLPAALNGRLASNIEAQMKSFPGRDPQMVHQMMRFFQATPGLVMALLFSLVFLFVFITCLSMAGGALGAKFVGRN